MKYFCLLQSRTYFSGGTESFTDWNQKLEKVWDRLFPFLLLPYRLVELRSCLHRPKKTWDRTGQTQKSRWVWQKLSWCVAAAADATAAATAAAATLFLMSEQCLACLFVQTWRTMQKLYPESPVMLRDLMSMVLMFHTGNRFVEDTHTEHLLCCALI